MISFLLLFITFLKNFLSFTIYGLGSMLQFMASNERGYLSVLGRETNAETKIDQVPYCLGLGPLPPTLNILNLLIIHQCCQSINTRIEY